jgi:hypothetical protein
MTRVFSVVVIGALLSCAAAPKLQAGDLTQCRNYYAQNLAQMRSLGITEDKFLMDCSPSSGLPSDAANLSGARIPSNSSLLRGMSPPVGAIVGPAR